MPHSQSEGCRGLHLHPGVTSSTQSPSKGFGISRCGMVLIDGQQLGEFFFVAMVGRYYAHISGVRISRDDDGHLHQPERAGRREG